MQPQSIIKNRRQVLVFQFIAFLSAMRPCFLLGQGVSLCACRLYYPLVRHFALLSWFVFLPVLLFVSWFISRTFNRQRMALRKTRVYWCGFTALGILVTLFRISIVARQEFVVSDSQNMLDEADFISSTNEEESSPQTDILLFFDETSPCSRLSGSGNSFVKMPLAFDEETERIVCPSLELSLFSEECLNQMASWTNCSIVLSPQSNVPASSVLACGAYPFLSGRCVAELENFNGDPDSVHILAIQSVVWPSEWNEEEVSSSIRTAQPGEDGSYVFLFSQTLNHLFKHPASIYEVPPQSFRLALSDPRHDVVFVDNGKRNILGNLEKTPEKIAKSFQENSLDGMFFLAGITWGELSSLLSFLTEGESFRLYVFSSEQSRLHGEAFAVATLQTMPRTDMDIQEVAGTLKFVPTP